MVSNSANQAELYMKNSLGIEPSKIPIKLLPIKETEILTLCYITGKHV